jgi:hypothetical protein
MLNYASTAVDQRNLEGLGAIEAQSKQLAISTSMGIPGTVKYSSSPAAPLGQHVNSPRDIGNMT